MRIFKTIIIFFIAIAAGLPAQTITAEKILLNVKANFDAVKDYSVTLTGTVNMERLKVPKMIVKLYFKQPNKFKTESKGTTFLPRTMLDINPTDLLNRFDGSVMGKEIVEGRSLYKIRLISKPEKGKQVRESFIWVDENNWTITRFESYPQEGRKIEIKIESIVIDGKYILPSKISASFDFEQKADSLAERFNPNRIPRSGSAELIYSDYHINTGLTDEFFEQKKKTE